MENPTDIAVRQILALRTEGPLRFADALSERLRSARRTVLRASIDDFHPVGHGARSAGGG
jgi:hypothetical protein